MLPAWHSTYTSVKRYTLKVKECCQWGLCWVFRMSNWGLGEGTFHPVALFGSLGLSAAVNQMLENWSVPPLLFGQDWFHDCAPCCSRLIWSEFLWCSCYVYLLAVTSGTSNESVVSILPYFSTNCHNFTKFSNHYPGNSFLHKRQTPTPVISHSSTFQSPKCFWIHRNLGERYLSYFRYPCLN